MRDAPSHSPRPSQSLRRTPTHAHSLHFFFHPLHCFTHARCIIIGLIVIIIHRSIYHTHTHSLLLYSSSSPRSFRISRSRAASPDTCHAMLCLHRPRIPLPVLPWSSPHSSPAPHTQFPVLASSHLLSSRPPARSSLALGTLALVASSVRFAIRCTCSLLIPPVLPSLPLAPSLFPSPVPLSAFHCFAPASVSLLLTHNYIVCSHPARLHHTTRRARSVPCSRRVRPPRGAYKWRARAHSKYCSNLVYTVA
ncbi:hypothetical protein C2E23DRAFT_593059 [Lenzites betulinus]|nr:hypothetical protein C2E23DRAFT_593059 [Lenzites betulinus]